MTIIYLLDLLEYWLWLVENVKVRAKNHLHRVSRTSTMPSSACCRSSSSSTAETSRTHSLKLMVSSAIYRTSARGIVRITVRLLSLPPSSDVDISPTRKLKELASFTGHASSIAGLHWTLRKIPQTVFCQTLKETGSFLSGKFQM